MSKIPRHIQRAILIMPLLATVVASLFPLQVGSRQTLVVFVLAWFNIFILFDVFRK